MSMVARIHFDRGALLLPARDPYEREVVIQEAQFYARRYGAVGLELGRQHVRVARSMEESGTACAQCGHAVGWVSFITGARRVCGRCAKRSVR